MSKYRCQYCKEVWDESELDDPEIPMCPECLEPFETEDKLEDDAEYEFDEDGENFEDDDDFEDDEYNDEREYIDEEYGNEIEEDEEDY